MAGGGSRVRCPRVMNLLLKEGFTRLPGNRKMSSMTTSERILKILDRDEICEEMFQNYVKGITRQENTSRKDLFFYKDALQKCPGEVLSNNIKDLRKKPVLSIGAIEKLKPEKRCPSLIRLYEMTIGVLKEENDSFVVCLDKLMSTYCPPEILTVKREAWKKDREGKDK